MCIAIYNHSKSTLTKSVLQTCWENNPHGAGLAFVKNKKIVVFKEMVSVDNFFRAYIQFKKDNPNVAFVLHFRIATHGKINRQNAHPFLIHGGNNAIFHNGIIPRLGDEKHSDTYYFSKVILNSFPHNFCQNKIFSSAVLNMIGMSKIIVLNRKTETCYIFNEKLGQKDKEGNWFSNGTYQKEENIFKSQYPFSKYFDNQNECIFCGETLYTADEQNMVQCVRCHTGGRL